MLNLKGVEFAKKLQSASSTLFAVHASLKQPMLKSTVLSACHLMESIKILLSSFYKWSMVMSESLMQIAQYITMLALSIASNVQVCKRISHATYFIWITCNQNNELVNFLFIFLEKIEDRKTSA